MTKDVKEENTLYSPFLKKENESTAKPNERILGQAFSNIDAIQIVHNDKTLYLSSEYLIDYKLYKTYMVDYEPLSIVELSDIIKDLFAFARISVAMFETQTGTLIGSAVSHLIYEAERAYGLRLDSHAQHGNLLTIDLTRFTTKALPEDSDWLGQYENWPDFLIFKDGASHEMRVFNVNRFTMTFAKWLQAKRVENFTPEDMSIIQHLIHTDDQDAVLNDDELQRLNRVMPFIVRNKLFTVHEEGIKKGRERISWIVCSGCIQSHVLKDTVGCKTMGFTTDKTTLAPTCPSMALTRID